MVVGRFRRTLSFPNPIQTIRPSKPPTTTTSKPYHVRSASLPYGRTHPLISQLRDETTELRLWEHRRSSSYYTTTAWSWLEEGLDHLKTIHTTLHDILQLPQTHDTLSNSLVSNLLEDYLHFVDIYGIFRTSMLALKQDLSSAQVAVRTTRAVVDSSSDSSYNNKLTSYNITAQRKAAKEISRLISAIRSVNFRQPTTSTSDLPPPHDNNNDNSNNNNNNDIDELSAVISEAHDLTVTVSAALFDGLLMLLGSSRRSASWAAGFGGFLTTKKKGRRVDVASGTSITVDDVMGVGTGGLEQLSRMTRVESMRLNRMKSNNKWEEDGGDAAAAAVRVGRLRSMQELEDRIGLMESGSEKVFRSLITTRVSLLNILTHSSC